MGKEKKNEDLKATEIELKVSMYCNACERSVAKAISKFKGVETFTTDMNRHRVVVTGHINPHKLLKKLKKKTRKRVEIIGKNNEEEETQTDNHNIAVAPPPPPPQQFFFDFICKEEVFMMFSDENPNACSIM
ncbi:heavy metal-associated isoprenylated plant protein 19 [Ricinus communis]|uniref:Copper ion binding protein, putative n=1 Tax=Ricinus communis TaxID=3988 RepID=B9RSX5_RICCO|nr:heavy metal-associated isoprenylated plant protein 19 [Ricinus communis]EEF45458.1 copper ion binding protein, putative [Ricinus communis]|eukprot:XP_025012722.1 heavy metal-associated isoprenylated plant protein 19 [Ricinus communis]